MNRVTPPGREAQAVSPQISREYLSPSRNERHSRGGPAATVYVDENRVRERERVDAPFIQVAILEIRQRGIRILAQAVGDDGEERLRHVIGAADHDDDP